MVICLKYFALGRNLGQFYNLRPIHTELVQIWMWRPLEAISTLLQHVCVGNIAHLAFAQFEGVKNSFQVTLHMK